MIGAIIGDMVGSIYEFENFKDKRFFFLTQFSFPTDDTIMTLAISRAMYEFTADGINTDEDKERLYERCIFYMRLYGERFPDAGYGGRFRKWLKSSNPKPYNSYGNGSAMRVSSIGWFAHSLDEALELAKISAEPTHNHEEGIKGAQAIATSIFLLREGKTKEELKDYIEKTFGYDLNRTIDEIRPKYKFSCSCQKTVPEAIIAFLEGTSFEDVIRNAVSIGGDSDTIAAMAGSLAEVIYPIPEEIRHSASYNLRKLNVFRSSDFIFYNDIVRSRKNPAFGNQSFIV